MIKDNLINRYNVKMGGKDMPHIIEIREGGHGFLVKAILDDSFDYLAPLTIYRDDEYLWDYWNTTIKEINSVDSPTIVIYYTDDYKYDNVDIARDIEVNIPRYRIVEALKELLDDSKRNAGR